MKLTMRILSHDKIEEEAHEEDDIASLNDEKIVEEGCENQVYKEEKGEDDIEEGEKESDEIAE
jgi:hypothetical protein